MVLSPLTFRGRLPGVVCETALPPAEEPLRLDVAAFVGFAERGPLDTPVAVEDPGQYRAVFGGDLLLARDGGRPVYANLPAAVQAFFDNGGRRCYMVRVAGETAGANQFRLPGLVAWDPAAGPLELRPTIVPAASVGRWSAAVRVGTQLEALPIRIAPGPDAYRPADVVEGAPAEIDLDLSSADALLPGDLLRLRFPGPARPLLLFPVAQVRARGLAASTVQGLPVSAVAAGATLALEAGLPDPLPIPLEVERLGTGGWEPLGAPLSGLEPVAGGRLALDLPAGAPVRVGDLLRITCEEVGSPLFAARTLLLPVAEVAQQSTPGSPLEAWLPGSPLDSFTRRVTGQSPLWEAAADPMGDPVEADRLRFDLFVCEGVDTLEVWSDLRFCAAPAAGSAAEMSGLSVGAGSSAAGRSWIDCLGSDPGELALGTDAAKLPRSARLGAPFQVTPAGALPLYLPLGMSALPSPDQFSGPLPLGETRPDPPRVPGSDGLDSFDPVSLFLDPRLADLGTSTVLGAAEELLYLSNPPSPLLKLHSLAPVEEVALIALPDVVHRPWGPPEPLAPEPEPPAPPAPSRDWSCFMDCIPPQPPAALPRWLPTEAHCSGPVALLPAPEAEPDEEADIQHQFAALPVLVEPARYGRAELEQLLATQRALVRLCAARADTLAVLSLPAHFDTRAVLDWRQRLAGAGSFLDDAALSYAALYYPWPLGPEPLTPELAPLRPSPPDGAVCGLIAARELARGAWVAPANVALRGVVGLIPSVPEGERAALFDARVNLLRQEPGRFSPLSAHTLSPDLQLVQVSARRLLIFLRKLALRRGLRYVFEPNNERFRQRVQASFENTLRALAGRGALAAFQVVADDGLNTPNDVDNGRFLIALKVAPTLPIEFITVILLRAGEGLLSVVER